MSRLQGNNTITTLMSRYLAKKNVIHFRNTRDSYGDNAIGFAQVAFCKEDKIFNLFCRVTPETKPKERPNIVEVQATWNQVLFARCYGCAAQAGIYL